MNALSNQLHYIFRIACAMCFIGHGAFGIITKPIWCNYFAVVGISETLAYQLMPVVGVIDIILGLSMIFYPTRAVAAWLVFWGLFTALLRPLSGEAVGEFLERAGNYGTPLAFLILSCAPETGMKNWFKKVTPTDNVRNNSLAHVIPCLQITAFLLLFGHGWLNLIEKKGLLDQYARVGFDHPISVARMIGSLEILGALLVLVKPFRSLILALFIWKMTSELLYPHFGVFEWIERGGSYAILLALWIVLKDKYDASKSLLIPAWGTRVRHTELN